MGAMAKSLSGPPVSPSLFRSSRSSASERPSPKAIQASLKESATLAAAISMQWKEEVSAMRRELADLRRDLCKELRAFNSNFNTFTQHYNTWSPQAGNTSAGADLSFDRGMGTGSRPRPGERGGVGRGSSAPNRGTGGAREKKPQVSKVSVGTQARTKVLVRQSTADAAVNCPEDKDDKKGARRSLLKQLSMDPSILACPQSMYVESAIPLTLDPILPCLIKTLRPEPPDTTAESSGDKAEPEIPNRITGTTTLSEIKNNECAAGRVGASAAALESPQETAAEERVMQLVHIDPDNENSSNACVSHSDDVKSPDSRLMKCDKMLPSQFSSVPVVTVSPPEEPDCDNISESGSHDPVSASPGAANVVAGLYTQTDAAEFELLSSDAPAASSSDTSSRVSSSQVQFDIKCPSIVVSEHHDPDPPASPADSGTGPVHVTFPDEDVEQVSPLPTVGFETQLCSDPETQDPEWPPLPEPLDTAPIYHADLVHFDLVMLTSLDQDDLDSVFMDPEPEPFDTSLDSPSNMDDLEPPVYRSDCSGSPGPATPRSFYPPQSSESVCPDPATDYWLAHTPQEAASELPLPLVTVTVSPPSSVSPDTSLELDFGPASPASNPSLENEPSGDAAHVEPGVRIVETLECVAVSREYVDPAAAAAAAEPGSPGRSSCEQAFLWYRWQKRGQRRTSMNRSASVELWSRRYEYNSAEITYVSLTL